MPPSEAAFLEAHRTGDTDTLVRLYCEEADRAEVAGDTDRACFFLTQAYVWALEAGHGDAPALHTRLRAYGREE